MRNLAPLSKLILTLVVTIWSFIIIDPLPLAGMTVLLAAAISVSRLGAAANKGALSLLLFAALLCGLQLVFGAPLTEALAASLRMLVMTYLFLLLLGTTRMQDLTAALVMQCRIPYEYAFMFTASLRFIPDLLAEIKAVQEAQACRGYGRQGNLLTRVVAYLSVVQPLVLRSVSRSETMAMALELRGFGSRGRRTFTANTTLSGLDYGLFLLLAGGTVLVSFSRFS